MKTINLTIVIDTAAIANGYPGPSQDPLQPTSISGANQFAVLTGTRATVEQGRGVALTAIVADQLMITALSGSNQFGDAVVLYDVQHSSGKRLFGHLGAQQYTTSTIIPSGNSEVLPGQIVDDAQFGFFQGGIRRHGQGCYSLSFGLWLGDSDPKLFGYFKWTMWFEVNRPHIPTPSLS